MSRPLGFFFVLTFYILCHSQLVRAQAFCRQALVQPSALTSVLASPLKLGERSSPVLRERAQEVSADDLASPDFQNFIGKLKSKMKRHATVGIAAPQVGVNKRVIFVKNILMINPRLKVLDEKGVTDFEMCLSTGFACGLVKRYANIEVEYLDEKGTPHKLSAKKNLAIIVRHEVDYLNGILFTDRQLTQKWKKLTDQLKKEMKNPYSLAWDLQSEKEIDELSRLLNENPNPTEIGAIFSEWVKSEAHALLLYDCFVRLGLTTYQPVLDYLVKNNLYFADAYPISRAAGIKQSKAIADHLFF
jgi:peptide deformylase